MRKKEWWEKELQFESIFASGRYAKNLWKYIPERLVKAVDDVSVDSSGYRFIWVHGSAILHSMPNTGIRM